MKSRTKIVPASSRNLVGARVRLVRRVRLRDGFVEVGTTGRISQTWRGTFAINFEGCAGAVRQIARSDFEIVPCKCDSYRDQTVTLLRILSEVFGAFQIDRKHFIRTYLRGREHSAGEAKLGEYELRIAAEEGIDLPELRGETPR